MIAPNAQERLTQIVEPLLFWYQKNKRSLPWRDQPTPYRVWVSEIMLQQTRVEAVKPYFERFLSQLPSIQALASCPEDRLLKLWEGLGYYSRAQSAKSRPPVGRTVRRTASRRLPTADCSARHR